MNNDVRSGRERSESHRGCWPSSISHARELRRRFAFLAVVVLRAVVNREGAEQDALIRHRAQAVELRRSLDLRIGWIEPVRAGPKYRIVRFHGRELREIIDLVIEARPSALMDAAAHAHDPFLAERIVEDGGVVIHMPFHGGLFLPVNAVGRGVEPACRVPLRIGRLQNARRRKPSSARRGSSHSNRARARRRRA